MVCCFDGDVATRQRPTAETAKNAAFLGYLRNTQDCGIPRFGRRAPYVPRPSRRPDSDVNRLRCTASRAASMATRHRPKTVISETAAPPGCLRSICVV